MKICPSSPNIGDHECPYNSQRVSDVFHVTGPAQLTEACTAHTQILLLGEFDNTYDALDSRGDARIQGLIGDIESPILELGVLVYLGVLQQESSWSLHGTHGDSGLLFMSMEKFSQCMHEFVERRVPLLQLIAAEAIDMHGSSSRDLDLLGLM